MMTLTSSCSDSDSARDDAETPGSACRGITLILTLNVLPEVLIDFGNGLRPGLKPEPCAAVAKRQKLRSANFQIRSAITRSCRECAATTAGPNLLRQSRGRT